MDLGDLFRRRRWRTLLNLIDGLPPNSHFVDALANDEEAMSALIDAPETAARERMAEWSPEVQKLAVVIDRLGELIQATVAAGGGKPSKFKPQPRPMTALDAARQKRVMADVAELQALWGSDE